MGDLVIWILFIGLGVLAVYLYFRFFKLFKVKSIVFIDGGLGTGKSFMSVAIAIKLHKKALRNWKIKKFFLGLMCFIDKKKFEPRLKELEKPLLYSNIRLRNYDFVKINQDLIFRHNFRFAYKSVVLFDEFSLVADQMLFRDKALNERLTLFFKLFRHETRGGYCVINSQSTSDLHYSLKYVLSDYLYLHHLSKFPLIWAFKCQEMSYCADKDGGQVVNANSGDIEDNLRIMLIFSKYRKYYDSYCYSVFTDMLPIYKINEFNVKGAYIKDSNLISFKDYVFLKENLEKRGSKDEKVKS